MNARMMFALRILVRFWLCLMQKSGQDRVQVIMYKYKLKEGVQLMFERSNDMHGKAQIDVEL